MAVKPVSDSLWARVWRSLSPRGVIWRGLRWRQVTEGLAMESNAIRSHVLDLVEESDPRTADATLDQWESVYGLPERCGGTLPSTDDERRAALTAKVTARGGQSEQYIIDVCAAAGYTVTVTTYSALCYGTGEYWESMYDAAWAYHFEVVGSAGAIPDWLQCRVKALKPAHVTVSFS